MLHMRAEAHEGPPDSWDNKIQRTLAEITRMHEERDRESVAKVQKLQKQMSQLKSHLRVIVSEYRNLRNQIEFSGQQSPVNKVRHEDDLLGSSMEHILMDEDVRHPMSVASACVMRSSWYQHGDSLQVDLVSDMMPPPDLHIDLPECTRQSMAGLSPWRAQGGAAPPTTAQPSAGTELHLSTSQTILQFSAMYIAHVSFIFICLRVQHGS